MNKQNISNKPPLKCSEFIVLSCTRWGEDISNILSIFIKRDIAIVFFSHLYNRFVPQNKKKLYFPFVFHYVNMTVIIDWCGWEVDKRRWIKKPSWNHFVNKELKSWPTQDLASCIRFVLLYWNTWGSWRQKISLGSHFEDSGPRLGVSIDLACSKDQSLR